MTFEHQDQELPRIDFISMLPEEVSIHILKFLEPKDLLQAAKTCKSWLILCDSNEIWKKKCKDDKIEFSTENADMPTIQRALRSRRRREKLGIVRTAFRENTVYFDRRLPFRYQLQEWQISWKDIYLREHNIEMNWRCQPIRPIGILKCHDNHAITCLQVHDKWILSGSDDSTMRLWSIKTGKCVASFDGHTAGVWCLQMLGNTIVSGGSDKTIRVWNAKSGDCQHIMLGHTATVRCLDLYEKILVSGSRDATLRVWNIESGICDRVLRGHLASVRCVKFNGTIAVSGSFDYTVRVWQANTGECLHTLEGHANRIYSLLFDGVHIVSGSLDTNIRIWDVKSGACKEILTDHRSLISWMESKDNLLVSGCGSSVVKAWDITTGECLFTLSGANMHSSAITSLQIIKKFVITASDDGTVKLWDLKTGKFVRNLVTLVSNRSGGVVWSIRASETFLVCAVGSRNGVEDTKLLTLNFDCDN